MLGEAATTIAPESHAKAASELVIVSNRLPVRRVKRAATQVWKTSPGGLVSALRPVLQELPSTWVGWPGAPDEMVMPFTQDGIQNWPVTLSKHELELYYEGFANRVLWPLFHDAIRAPEYRQEWWQPYVKVNQRFAAAAAEAAGPRGTVWVHDYHLLLVPAMLRELRSDLRIGFFLHIPFPPQELFAQLPWRREILQGLLGSDVLGFQTKIGSQNFAQVARRFAGAAGTDDFIQYAGRTVAAASFPISVDFAHYDGMARSDAVIAKADEFRRKLGVSRRIILGIDRLDYTKGIDTRLRAFHQLLKNRPSLRDECTFVQVAVPSRERVDEYRELRVIVERLVGEINGEFGDIGRTPVQYFHRSVPARDLVGLYAAADVMLVTPLRDGMNLVAKEYVASRVNDDGVLVLSEFTGASQELRSALHVNPHDIQGVVAALERALAMPHDEQRHRMQSMRRIVQRNDVHHWANTFFHILAYERA